MFDLKEQLCEYIQGDSTIDNDDLEKIMNILMVTELELVEEYAYTDDEMYDSEEALTEAFDEQIAPMVIEQYGPDDHPAMREAFNNWTDSECRDGRLHQSQYDEYTYDTCNGEYREAFR